MKTNWQDWYQVEDLVRKDPSSDIIWSARIEDRLSDPVLDRVRDPVWARIREVWNSLGEALDED